MDVRTKKLIEQYAPEIALVNVHANCGASSAMFMVLVDKSCLGFYRGTQRKFEEVAKQEGILTVEMGAIVNTSKKQQKALSRLFKVIAKDIKSEHLLGFLLAMGAEWIGQERAIYNIYKWAVKPEVSFDAYAKVVFCGLNMKCLLVEKAPVFVEFWHGLKMKGIWGLCIPFSDFEKIPSSLCGHIGKVLIEKASSDE